MLFNSLAFAIFLPIVFILYWAIPHKYRYIVLLIASYYFYMSWNPKYVLLILLTTIVSYGCAIMVEKYVPVSKKKAKFCVFAALLICLGVLFVFKYFNFASNSLCILLSKLAIPMHPVTIKVMLPVGISFYTFQSLSYVIDVYRGEVKPQKNFLKYALFISFFPQLVAGPIERTKNLMPQLFEDRPFDEKKAVWGLRLMLVGFIKKLILSDFLAVYVDRIFDNVYDYYGMTFIFAAIFFTFQIYCDFSGYSDIAVGCAKLLNIDLMQNFNSPYQAVSIRDFWSRWHISLSTWFRDYVYIPLGGSRCSKVRSDVNTMITMLVSGLWHGADWTFVIWGGLHGVYQIVERRLKRGRLKNIFDASFTENQKTQKRIYTVGQTVITFALVSFAWIFFRANSMSDAFYVVTHLHNGVIHVTKAFWRMMIDMTLDWAKLFKLLICLVGLGVYDLFSKKRDVLSDMDKIPVVIRWIGYVAVVTAIIVEMVHGGTTQSFIYFQF